MSRPKFYIGWNGRAYDILKLAVEPSHATHGTKYSHFVGPFATRRGAEFMARPEQRNNPHVQTSDDADRIARDLARRGEL